jgi:predicted double-glycine peptidase
MNLRGFLAAAALIGLTAVPASAAAPSNDCRFVLGFAALHDSDPADVGTCLDNQAFAANGDAIQHTTKGMLAWRKADNWTAFTDGYQTWLNGPSGLVKRFNDEWFEWEAYPAETDGVPVHEDPPAPASPSEVSLGALIHTDQTLDNCGPAAIAQVLRYYGITKSQQELQGILRVGNPTGMTTDVIEPYANSLGLRALVRPNSSDALIKSLVRAGFPAIAEQTVSSSDSQLHYRAIEGYDDRLQQFVVADTLLGPRHVIGYAEFDRVWARTNRELVVIYPPDRRQALGAALAAAAHS